MSAFVNLPSRKHDGGGRTSSIRRLLLLLVLSTLLPIWAGAVLVFIFSYGAERDEFASHLKVAAQSIAQTGDRYFAGLGGALAALAASPSLAARDFQAFRGQAESLVGNYPAGTVVVAGADGTQMFNSSAPSGQALGRRSDAVAVGRVLAAGGAVVSGGFKGVLSHRHQISVDVPARSGGGDALDLGMTLPTVEIAKIFSSPDLPEGWVMEVLDGNGTCLTASRDLKCAAGEAIDPVLFAKARTGAGTTFDYEPGDMGTMIMAASRSDVTGWTVILGQRWAGMSWSAVHRLPFLAIVGVLGSCLLSFLVLTVGRRISVAISSLLDAAVLMGKSHPCADRWSDGFVETAAVREALDRAEQLYLLREGEREADEWQLRFYRGLMEQVNDCLYAYAPWDGGRVIFANEAASRHFGYDRQKMSALAVSDLDAAHSSDRAAGIEIQLASGQERVTTRARHRKAGGDVVAVDVVMRTVPCRGGDAVVVSFADPGDRPAQPFDNAVALSVFASSPEGIVVTDAANRIIEVNPAFTTMTGYALDDVFGRDPKMLGSGFTPPMVFREMWAALRDRGFWQGELINRAKDGTEYTEWLTISALRDHTGAIYRYIGMFADISDWKKSQETILHQANYDSLTGLPNRRLFRDRLEHEMKKMDRDRGHLALLFIDIDRFKEVNDIMGHDMGDELLVEASRRMSGCVRLSDTVARLGGDEFAIILAGVPNPQLVERIATQVKTVLETPFVLRGSPSHVSASIGITLYPVDAQNAEMLMKNADQAMYAAKSLGRNRFCWFTDTMQKEAEERMSLANDLRSAIASGQLQVYFQPIVDLASGRVVKAEALLRWMHPVHGLISPVKFIPVAEETGQIAALGNWVFRQSALMAKEWVDWAIAEGDAELAGLIKISVNKSPKQFHVATTYENWVGIMAEIGIDPRHIIIEITENLFLGDQIDMAEKLRRFRDIGMGLSLDDFGTGYSSLGYLKKYEVDYLKMDQSFVRDMLDNASDRAIAEAIMAMAQRLKLDVVAEGIETPEQRDFLVNAGCRYGQGFLFHKPLPIEAFRAIVMPSQGGGKTPG